jgi:hypothetical protein
MKREDQKQPSQGGWPTRGTVIALVKLYYAGYLPTYRDFIGAIRFLAGR